MPFVLFGLHRHFATGRLRPLIGAAAAWLVQNLSCGYYLLFFSPFAAAFDNSRAAQAVNNQRLMRPSLSEQAGQCAHRQKQDEHRGKSGRDHIDWPADRLIISPRAALAIQPLRGAICSRPETERELLQCLSCCGSSRVRA